MRDPSAQLLTRLESLDVRLWAEGDRVRFNAPKGVMTAALRQEVSRHKARLLEHLRGAPEVPLGALPRPAELPLSFAQSRLWFLDRFARLPARRGDDLAADVAAHHLQTTLEIRGPLRRGVLAGSFHEVARRHEALRTTVAVNEAGEGVQRIIPRLRLTLPLIDLTALDETRREVEARRRIIEEVRRPFDLEHGPLIRLMLLRTAPQRHLLLLAPHHIVADGWSMGILVREMAILYHASLEGRDSPLPETALHYADFTLWQRSRLDERTLKEQLTYWRRRLGDARTTLELPTDRRRGRLRGGRGGRGGPLVVSRQLTRQLEGLGRSRQATLFMTFLTAYFALLHRLSGQCDLLVGAPMTHRKRLELEGLVGLLANTLVLRGDLSGGPTFLTALERVRDVVLEAWAHEDLPFEKLVEELHPHRDLSRTPLFQVALIVQNAPAPNFEMPGLTIRRLPIDARVAMFDLTLTLAPGSDGDWQGSLEYSSDLFDRATATRWGDHWKSLLRGVATYPERGLGELDLLSSGQRQQLLLEWNDTGIEGGRHSLLDLLELQAESTPDRVAVCLANEVGAMLCYGELERRAHRLAQALGRLGVAPGSETRVGLCLERSLDMVVAVWGVLRAGGIYVPLDPSHPRQRLRLILDDAGVAVLLTQSGLLADLPEHDAALLLVDRDLPPTDREASWPPATARRIQPRQLAYVIYTSGSTGRPKGVEVSHHSLVNFLTSMARRPGFSSQDVLLAVTTLAFDIAGLELYLPLVCGGRVVVAPRAASTDAVALARLMDRSRATVMQATPATWRLLLESPWQGDPALRVLCGGEALPGDLAERLRAACGELWNLYGPTETTVWSAVGRVTGSDISIGSPIVETVVRVLDRGGRLVVPGATGEIVIGGEGLARGYLGRPGPTAERFRPDGFRSNGLGADEPGGARFYHTGDLGCHRHDGTLEYLGRLDHQVKIRGFRVELGEIEAVLRSHPSVRHAAVSVWNHDGDHRLAAYVVGAAVPRELRGFLGHHLPDYMIPATFVELESLPLNASGKLDRAALGRAASSAGSPEQAHVAPATPIELELAAIWADVLGLDAASARKVGADDHFFEIGGHSLLAARVVSRLRRVLGVELPLRTLFEKPTLGELAAQVEADMSRGPGVELPPIEPLARQAGGLASSFAQERLWFLDRIEPGTPAYNLAAAMRLDGDLDVSVLGASLDELARRHETLRTRFDAPAGEPRQVVEAALEVALPVVDLSGLADVRQQAALQRRADAEANRSFDLVEGPLLRVVLLRLGRQAHVALFTMHHIVSDAWSMEILVRELATLYEALPWQRPVPLPDLSIQYADFAAWQRQRLRGEVLERELSYWREHLAGLPPLLDLPTDRPRRAVATTRGGLVVQRWPASRGDKVRQLGQRAQASVFMTLLAGFTTLLHRLSGQDLLSVGSPVAGRPHEELEHLIGFFVNTLVLRGSYRPEQSFDEHLARVRETCLGAYAHQEVPFERLVAELAPERSLSHTPLFQVMLVFAAARAPLPELPKLALTPHPAGRGQAQMGMMTLSITERRDGLDLAWAYNRDLYDSVTVERLASHLGILLEAAAEPDVTLAEISLLSSAQRHQVSHEWNDTHRALGGWCSMPVQEPWTARSEDPKGAPAFCGPARAPGRAWSTSLLETIEQAGVPNRLTNQARRAPEAVALVADHGHTSYGELDRRAERLARYLRALGAGPERLVAIYLERSPDLIAALLGIWKTGAAFLPLDPTAPAYRVAFTLEDAGVRWVVTHQRLAANLPATQARVVRLDADRAAIERRGSKPVTDRRGCPPGDGRHLAYVLYTSGSTGRPKGVMVEQASVDNIVTSFVSSYALGARDSVLQQTTITFDVAVNEILPILSVGGTLVLAPADEVADPERLIARIVARRVSVMGAAPSLLAHFNERVASEVEEGRVTGGLGLGRLRLVLSGGEALSLSDVDQLRTAARVVNGYGPTEATVCALAHDLAAPRRGSGRRIPIGRPLTNYQAVVRDRNGQFLGIGLPGELCLAGRGLARGYFASPAQTARVFVPHPLGVGARLYRSGDLARWLTDGNMEFLGRLDDQVKIRGFRIELGEIEAVLAEHPGLREAAVMAREDTPGHQRLVAYCVRRGPAATDAELRAFLEGRLPAYMVPAMYVDLEALPLLPSGKVDHRALPAPDPAANPGEIIGPRDEVERGLLEIWEDLLEVRPISIDADFFELGGYSLLAVHLVRRIRKTFDKSIPVAGVFQEPTIERLAGLLRRETVLDWSPLLAIRSEGSRPPLFCVHPVSGEAIAYHALARHLGDDQPFYALQASPAVVATRHGLSVEETAALYIETIRRVVPEGPLFLGGYSYGCVVTFEMARQLREAGDEVALLVMLDGQFLGSRLFREQVGMRQNRPRILWQRIKAAVAYRPGVYPGRIVYLHAEGHSAWKNWRNLRKWKRLSGKPIEIIEIEGDHLGILQEPHVIRVSEVLRDIIDRKMEAK